MRFLAGYILSSVVMLSSISLGRAQTASAAASDKGPGAANHADGMPVATVAAPDARTEKQKALAKQAERLCDLAAELKVQVDKTNKNILSLTVVAKAEEIEALAKGIRNQAKSR